MQKRTLTVRFNRAVAATTPSTVQVTVTPLATTSAVADNITFPESVQELMKRYQAHVRAYPNVRSHFLSVGSGLEMSVKIAD